MHARDAVDTMEWRLKFKSLHAEVIYVLYHLSMACTVLATMATVLVMEATSLGRVSVWKCLERASVLERKIHGNTAHCLPLYPAPPRKHNEQL